MYSPELISNVLAMSAKDGPRKAALAFGVSLSVVYKWQKEHGVAVKHPQIPRSKQKSAAKRAATVGDHVVATELGVHPKTVARWRYERGLSRKRVLPLWKRVVRWFSKRPKGAARP